MLNPAFGGQFGPENKLIEGQPNEYDVICRNASVLAFHLWPTIFAGAPFRLQDICRNGVPPRSRTTTPLHVTVYHYNDTRSTVTRRWSFDNDKRHVTACRPISEAAHSWSYDSEQLREHD